MSSSAKRALAILGAVGDAGRPMGVSEIARAIGTAPGTAFRALDALHRAQLLSRQPSTSRYGLGPASLGLRQTLLSQFRIRDVCLPYLRQLASLSGETTSLHVRVGWYAARIAASPGSADVTSGSAAEGTQPLCSSIAGRAILAHLGRKEIARHLTWATAEAVRPLPGVNRELAAIRAGGYATVPAVEAGTAAGFAFPIRKADQAFAAIAVEGFGAARAGSRPAPAPEWLKIAQDLEALVQANPALSGQPFGHLNPDELVLPS